MEANLWLSNKKSPSFGWGCSCKFYTWGYNVQGKVQFILFILHLKKSWMFETHFVAVGKVSMLILYDIVLGHGSMVYSLGVGLKGPALVRFHVIKKKKNNFMTLF